MSTLNTYIYVILTLLYLSLTIHSPLAFAKPNSSLVTSKDVPQYPPGEGGRFVMVNGSDRTALTVFFVDSPKESVVFEVFLKSLSDSSALKIEMSQQFHLKLVGGTFQLVKGIMKIPQLDKPQLLPLAALGGVGSLQMKGFLIGSAQDLGGQKMGEETITENGVKYKSTRYKKSEGGQTVEYWLSDEAKPIGIVRMKSQGQKSGENYTLSYLGAVKNEKSRINASQAEEMSAAAAMFLPLLNGSGEFPSK